MPAQKNQKNFNNRRRLCSNTVYFCRSLEVTRTTLDQNLLIPM